LCGPAQLSNTDRPSCVQRHVHVADARLSKSKNFSSEISACVAVRAEGQELPRYPPASLQRPLAYPFAAQRAGNLDRTFPIFPQDLRAGFQVSCDGQMWIRRVRGEPRPARYSVATGDGPVASAFGSAIANVLQLLGYVMVILPQVTLLSAISNSSSLVDDYGTQLSECVDARLAPVRYCKGAHYFDFQPRRWCCSRACGIRCTAKNRGGCFRNGPALADSRTPSRLLARHSKKRAKVRDAPGVGCWPGVPLNGEPAGTRTQDPVIKSHVLCRLSYGLSARSRWRRPAGGAEHRLRAMANQCRRP
jgi:hypothetical protein